MGQGSGAPFSAAANRRRPAGSGAANPSSDEAIIAKKVMPSNWLRLDTETVRTGRLYSGADLTTDYIHATAGFSYTLPLDGCFQMDLLAGVCLWNIDVEFEKDNYTANLDAQGVQVGLTFKF